MPQADANAFKTLKRNHALLKRKSRDAFDIYGKNTRLKKNRAKYTIPELTNAQRKDIQKKVIQYKRIERRGVLIKWIITLILTPIIVYYGYRILSQILGRLAI